MQVKIETVEGQVQSIRSPMVGKAVIQVDDEALLKAGDHLGYIESIHQKLPLTLPDDLEGIWQMKGVKRTPYLLEYQSEIAKIYPFKLGHLDQEAGIGGGGHRHLREPRARRRSPAIRRALRNPDSPASRPSLPGLPRSRKTTGRAPPRHS